MKKLLGNRNFLFLVIGQVISLFGSGIQRFAMSLYLLDLTGNASIFANILALSIVPIIVLSPFAGILSDRADRRKIMIVLDLLSGLCIAMYALVLFQGKDNDWIAGGVMMILSGISTLYQPAVNASIPLIVKDEELTSANGVVAQVGSLSNFFGPILAGILYGVFGIQVVICLNAVSFFASAVLECFLDIPFVKPEKSKVSPVKLFVLEIKEGVHYLKNENKHVLRLVEASGMYNLFLVPVFSVCTPYIIKVMLAMPSEVYGVSEGIMVIGMIAGGMFISARPNFLGIRRIYCVSYAMSAAMWFMAGSLLVMPMDSREGRFGMLACMTVGIAVIMFALGVANVIQMTFIQRTTKPQMLGKVMAFSTAIATMCVPLGQILYGKLVDQFAGQMALLVFVSGVCTLGVTLFVRWSVRKIEE